MQQNIEFERCIDFLVRMIDKYGEEVLRELEEENRIKKKKQHRILLFIAFVRPSKSPFHRFGLLFSIGNRVFLFLDLPEIISCPE